jgi:hypothetical protein
MKRHVTCFVEKAGFEPRTLITKAERYDHCATRPVNLLSMQWLQVHSANNQASFSYVQINMAAALQMLEADCKITSSSDGDALLLPSEGLACVPDAAGFLLADQKIIPKQHTFTEFTRRTFFADLSPHNKHRLNQVSLLQVPARHASYDIAPPRHHAHDTLRQVPMALWALTCHYELPDQAVFVSLAISLGTPIPHARYLKEHVTEYADADVWRDSLLNKAENGSTSWKATHDKVAAELASIATGGGVPATAVERKIPFLDATTPRSGDLMTTVGGLIPFVGRPVYNQHTWTLSQRPITYANQNASPQWKLKNGGNTPLDIVTKAMLSPRWLPTRGVCVAQI